MLSTEVNFYLLLPFWLKCYIQVRQVIATIIFLKGVGGILFVFGSTFGSFLLVRGASSLSFLMDIYCHSEIYFLSFYIVLILKHYNPNWNFHFCFCSFHIWRLLLHFCMISTTIDLIGQNIVYCWMSSFRYMQTIAFSCVSGWWFMSSLWEPNIHVHFWLQSVALFGALLFFVGMKNSIPRKQIRKKTPKAKAV